MTPRAVENFPRAARLILTSHLRRGTPFAEAWRDVLMRVFPREGGWTTGTGQESPLAFARMCFEREYSARSGDISTVSRSSADTREGRIFLSPLARGDLASSAR